MALSERNIWRNKLAFYLLKVDLIGLILFSIYEKWQQAGMSFSQILLLQGLFGLFILLAEFPSGILADIRSRKELLLIGQIMIILGIGVYSYTSTFSGFLVAELCFALGLASKSGTDAAYIYDSYLELDQYDKADDTIARGMQIAMFGNIFTLSLGGYLSAINQNIPFILAIIGYMIGSMSLYYSAEPIRQKVERSSVALKKSIGYLSHAAVLKVLLMMILLGVMLRVAFWAYIPKLENTVLDAKWHGLILGGANLIAFLSSIWARKNKDHEYIIYLVPLGVVGLFLMLFDGLGIILMAIFLHQVSRGLINIVSGIYLNREVSSDVRASISSLVGTIISLIYFLFSLGVDLISLGQLQILIINLFLGLVFVIIWYLSQILPGRRISLTETAVKTIVAD